MKWINALLSVCFLILSISLLGCSNGKSALEPPFDSIIPQCIKTAPTTCYEYSRAGNSLKGTHYTDNRIIAVHYRGCEGKDVTCGMCIEVLLNNHDAATYFEKEERTITKICCWTSHEMFTYFAKQKPDNVLVYQLDILPDGEHEKGEVEYGILFRVDRYVAHYRLNVFDPLPEPDPYSGRIYDIGYENLEALWLAVDRTIPRLGALTP